MSIPLEMLRTLIREEFSKATGKNTHSNHVQNCPSCYKHAIEQLNQSSEYVCDGCGLPLGSGDFAAKLESCPNCHSTDAKKVR